VLQGRVEIGAQEDAPSSEFHLLDRQLHRRRYSVLPMKRIRSRTRDE
jgi:hypothetical protein